MMAGVAGMGAPLPPAPPYHAPVPSQVPPPPPSGAAVAPVAPPPPSAAMNGQRTAEYQQRKDRERHEAKKRHEEEKRRKEKERERHEREKREREKQKQLALQRQQDAPENRLRRDTPFLCHIRFKNDLPEIPSDPKMLISQVQPERLAQFALTAFEKEPKRDLVLLPDLGIPISLLDVERYQVPETRPPLDPADAALLQDEPSERLKNMSPASRKREGFASRIRGNAPTTWLMRTTYISNDSDTIRRQGLSEKRTKTLAGGAGAPDAEDAEDNVEAKIAAIEASFEAAQKPPRHIKNPALQPVEILPFLPDFDSWHFKYVMTAFDSDPCGEVEQLARLPPAAQRAAAPRMMLRGFTLNQNGPEQEKFMALMVPNASVEELESATDREVPPEELVGDYSWAKEYNYNMFRYEGEDTDQQQYFVRLRDGLATYCELSMKLELKKREGALGGAAKRKRRARSGSPNKEGEDGEEDEEAGRNKAPDFVRPSKMVIGTRDYTEQEVMQHQAKRARLLQEEEEG